MHIKKSSKENKNNNLMDFPQYFAINNLVKIFILTFLT